MKKLIYLLAIALMSTGLTSCYKSWDCVCTTTTTYNGSVTETDRYSIPVVGFKGRSETACNKGDDDNYYGGLGTTVTECELR